MVHVVLLSGGSGTRLWPLSNNARSKQFLKVLRDDSGQHVSMVQRVLSQIGKTSIELDVTIATTALQEQSLRMQIDGEYSLVLEPERRDTASAIMLACAYLMFEQNARANDTVVVLPIDTFADQSYYDKIAALDVAVQQGVAELVLLGVKPTYPSAKYGYIIPVQHEANLGKASVHTYKSSLFHVASFKEKPDEREAAKLISGGALWNCGVFAFRLEYLTEIMKRYLKPSDFSDVITNYSKLPKRSFDYEIVESAASVAALPYTGIWKDLGTWNTLSEEMIDEAAGRVVIDSASSANTHVINETGLPLVVSGIEDAVIIATHDGILACSKEMSASASLKQLVNDASISRPMYERRLWGEYRVLDATLYQDGSKSLTKELIIEQGMQLSYQRHGLRSENWTVTNGIGEVVLDGVVRSVAPGSTISIKPGNIHAVRAFEELHIIEVQLGNTLVEEDIERFGYFWEQ